MPVMSWSELLRGTPCSEGELRRSAPPPHWGVRRSRAVCIRRGVWMVCTGTLHQRLSGVALSRIVVGKRVPPGEDGWKAGIRFSDTLELIPSASGPGHSDGVSGEGCMQ